MRELIGKDENKRQSFRYRETRDKEKENRMNNIVWMQCMDCSARRSWPYGRCENCMYNIAHMTNDPAKAKEIFISQMAAKDVGDRAHRDLMHEHAVYSTIGLLAGLLPILYICGSFLIDCFTNQIK